jgi:hypothetical protein
LPERRPQMTYAPRLSISIDIAMKPMIV